MPARQQTRGEAPAGLQPGRRPPAAEDLGQGPAGPAGLVDRARRAPARLSAAEVRQLQRLTGNQAVSRRLSAARPRPGARALEPLIQREWDEGLAGPEPFDPAAALAAADFSDCVYVQAARAVKKSWHYTVYAYAYVNVGGYRVCVVAHAHITGNVNQDASWGPGNVYIPGWVGWDTATPAAVVTTLRNAWKADLAAAVAKDFKLPGGLILDGAFPGAGRYPVKIEA